MVRLLFDKTVEITENFVEELKNNEFYIGLDQAVIIVEVVVANDFKRLIVRDDDCLMLHDWIGIYCNKNDHVSFRVSNIEKIIIMK